MRELKAYIHNHGPNEPCSLVNDLTKQIVNNIDNQKVQIAIEIKIQKLRNYIIKLTVDIELLNDLRRTKIIDWTV